MSIDIIMNINNDPLQKQFLRENSYWYKYLNRNEDYLKLFEEKMKEDYKLTSLDKLNNFSKNLSMIVKFMDILK